MVQTIYHFQSVSCLDALEEIKNVIKIKYPASSNLTGIESPVSLLSYHQSVLIPEMKETCQYQHLQSSSNSF